MVRTIVSSLLKGENQKYEEAVKTLNTLQTNAQTLEKIRQERDKNAHLNIPNMIKYAARAGVSEVDVDRLNIIHVSGTKGKGSTCAFCESMLRHHGYKTGFFSSPHLVEVRERFVVDGKPLDRDSFTAYFWDVYNKLEKSKESNEGRMPNYFGFLTVMAMHVFLQEKVDVAIIEVGIGGSFDSTNFIRKPVVCGVTSLGLDHVSILGNTIDKIAWHKSGIFKPGVPAFTSPQLPEAMTVLSNRAQELGASLKVAPNISAYEDIPSLGIKGRMQNVNASLALQLCQSWIKQHTERQKEDTSTTTSECSPLTNQLSSLPIEVSSPFQLTPPYIQGLSKCQWLGRNQKIEEDGLTFYLDGAHTLESIEQCVEWFKEESDKEKNSLDEDVFRVLIFNMTGDRDIEILLTPIQTCDFDAVLFCPNIAYEESKNEDQNNKTVTKESQLKRCSLHKIAWEQLEQKTRLGKDDLSLEGHTNGHATAVFHQKDSVHNGDTVTDGNRTFTMAYPCISDCVKWVHNHSRVKQGKKLKGEKSCDTSVLNGAKGEGAIDTEVACGNVPTSTEHSSLQHVIKNSHLQVLVTGSLHLVGGALKVIWDRELDDE